LNGALFCFVSMLNNWAVTGVMNVIDDFPMLVREHYDGMYSVWLFSVTKVR
jgi:hypothetical protein